MKKSSLFIGYARSVRLLTRDRVLLLVALATFIIIAMVTLRAAAPASALGGTFTTARTGSGNLARSCTSEGTAFENTWSISGLEKILQEQVSLAVDERMQILSTPSSWVCPTSLQKSPAPPVPALEALATRMPGWNHEYRIPIPLIGGFTFRYLAKPVFFENFASILSEFRREYECRLQELEEDKDVAIQKNADLDTEDAIFCCNPQKECVQKKPEITCAGSESADPECGKVCKIRLNNAEFANRRATFHQDLGIARTRARVAMDRTFFAMRSLESNFVYAHELMCYARVSLDLRNELNLLAESTSCMPKIWDALTSLHDPKP